MKTSVPREIAVDWERFVEEAFRIGHSIIKKAGAEHRFQGHSVASLSLPISHWKAKHDDPHLVSAFANAIEIGLCVSLETCTDKRLYLYGCLDFLRRLFECFDEKPSDEQPIGMGLYFRVMANVLPNPTLSRSRVRDSAISVFGTATHNPDSKRQYELEVSRRNVELQRTIDNLKSASLKLPEFAPESLVDAFVAYDDEEHAKVVEGHLAQRMNGQKKSGSGCMIVVIAALLWLVCTA